MKRILFAAFIFLNSIVAQADPYSESITALAGTHSVLFEEQTRAGVLQNCTLVYKSIILDHTYAKGAPYLVHGSIGVGLNDRNQMLSSLKVITNRMVWEGGKLVMKPERPYFAYLKSPDGVTNIKGFIDKTDSDTPGGLFEVFNADNSLMDILDGIVLKKKVTVVFNRHANGLDFNVPLETDVVDTKDGGKRIRNMNQLISFMQCMQNLAEKAR